MGPGGQPRQAHSSSSLTAVVGLAHTGTTWKVSISGRRSMRSARHSPLFAREPFWQAQPRSLHSSQRAAALMLCTLVWIFSRAQAQEHQSQPGSSGPQCTLFRHTPVGRLIMVACPFSHPWSQIRGREAYCVLMAYSYLPGPVW